MVIVCQVDGLEVWQTSKLQNGRTLFDAELYLAVHKYFVSISLNIIHCICTFLLSYPYYDYVIIRKYNELSHGTDDRLYQMSHSAKIVSVIFYEHTLAAILAVSVIHAMKREQSRILAVSAILAVSVARVIWRDSLAKIADTKIIGIDTQ